MIRPSQLRGAHRPRVEGDREQEILATALEVLGEVGYDRLTMDAVASRAKASKATLYRRWSSKAKLILDALMADKEPLRDVDTGDLRGDLVETLSGPGGLTDGHQIGILGSVGTAIACDPEFAEAFRRDFIGPKASVNRTIFERARARGELRDEVDLDLVAPAAAGIVLHRTLLMGELPTRDLVERVVDQIILPAVVRRDSPAEAPRSREGTDR